MNKTVFDFQDYKRYLMVVIRSKPGKGRGFRAEMAGALGCQRAFVSKVLHPDSPSHFSLEQAVKLNSLLGHTSDEANFFLLLVQYARAGTEELREHFRDQMKFVLNRRLTAQKERQSRNVLSPEDHLVYYSSWLYSALHVAVSIPGLQTKEELARRLQLPVPVIAGALEFLASRGLIEQKGDRFSHQAKQQVHLSSEHGMISKHHSNWRMRGLASLDRQAPQDLHYSYVVTLSQHDALRIRSFLVQAIEEVLKRAAPSKEEAIYAFCLDYFEP